ncbi:MAG: sensory transduction histidine kinase [Deltaproteobacteria bacterium]|nr:sensory transduction histidine kinase [Deltaproteobacteria bacterium]
MEDKHPSKEKLIQETTTLRRQVADLEKLLQGHAEKEKYLTHLASFPELNPNPVLEVNFTGDLIYVNPAAKKLFPDLEDRGIQHPWFQGWNSLGALAKGSRENCLTREIQVDSAWFEQQIYYVREMKSLRFYGYNITERKRAAEGLRESEMRLRAVMDNMPVGVWFTDESGKILYGNAAGQQIWQGARYVGPEEFHEFKAWWADTGVRVRPDDWAVARAVRKGETSLNEVLEIECFDGTRKTIINSAVPLHTGDGRIFGVVALNEDVTERKRVEKDLKQAHELLEAVTEGTKVIMAAQDQNFCYTFFNKEYQEEIKRITGKDIHIGTSMIDVFAHMPEQQKIAVAEWSQVLRGESTNKTLEFGDPARHRRVYNVLHTPIRDDDEKVIGAGEVAYDITERVRMEEALHHSEAQFKLLSETAGRLLAASNPQEVVDEICRKVMAYLDCQTFFNFLADEEARGLRLNACAGIPEEEARKIEWLDYGVAVCGCAARDGVRIVATDIFNTPDPRTDLVKSYGIQAYACHPLLVRDQVIGTLSFGTRKRTSFAPEELALMKTVADQIAIAMERIKLLEDLRRSRDELELKVQERTRDLAKAHREMVEQSRILEGFFASTITPIVLLDKNFNFIRVNEAYAKGCGMEVAEFQGRNHFELFPHEENAAIFRSVVETKRPYRAVAKPFAFPDHPEWGTTYWDWILTPVLDEEEQVEYLVFSLNEVTEQVKVQEKIRKNEELLRTVLENLPVGVWVMDQGGNLVQGNPAGEKIWAGSRLWGALQEREYKGWRLSSGEKIAPKEWGAVRAIAKGETTLNEEVEIECFDGTRKMILHSAVPIRNARQEITGAIIVNQDITARKKAEGELRVASLYARSLIEASLDPLVTIRADGKIMDVNRATETITGVNREDLIGSDFSTYFTEPERAREGYRKVFEEGMVRDYPLAIRHIAGGVADVLYNATLFKNEAGEIQGIFAAARDITEKKKAEQALRESENQLRVLSAQLLTAHEDERKRVSRELHDGLQQTLTAIKFKVEAFLLGMNKTRLKEKAKTLEPIVSMIQESVREIRRIQANLRPPMLDDLGILASLAWLFREFQGTYPDIRVEKAFQVEESDIPEELKMVIYRILQEALNNIGKHSGAERVSISLRKMENLLELGIRDNGRGFDPQEAFSKEKKEKGMGLASMKERVESSNGLFAVQSHIGKGTLIQASWP